MVVEGRCWGFRRGSRFTALLYSRYNIQRVDSDVNCPVGRPGTVGYPRFIQDGRDSAKAVRPVLTRRGRLDGRGLPGTALSPSLADIVGLRPVSSPQRALIIWVFYKAKDE